MDCLVTQADLRQNCPPGARPASGRRSSWLWLGWLNPEPVRPVGFIVTSPRNWDTKGGFLGGSRPLEGQPREWPRVPVGI